MRATSAMLVCLAACSSARRLRTGRLGRSRPRAGDRDRGDAGRVRACAIGGPSGRGRPAHRARTGKRCCFEEIEIRLDETRTVVHEHEVGESTAVTLRFDQPGARRGNPPCRPWEPSPRTWPRAPDCWRSTATPAARAPCTSRPCPRTGDEVLVASSADRLGDAVAPAPVDLRGLRLRLLLVLGRSGRGRGRILPAAEGGQDQGKGQGARSSPGPAVRSHGCLSLKGPVVLPSSSIVTCSIP